MTAQLEARAFAIWRYASRRDWDCSYDEIAEATGLTYNQVMSAIAVKGWGGRIRKGQSPRFADNSNAGRKALGHRFDENALDLCQLIGGR